MKIATGTKIFAYYDELLERFFFSIGKIQHPLPPNFTEHGYYEYGNEDFPDLTFRLFWLYLEVPIKIFQRSQNHNNDAQN